MFIETQEHHEMMYEFDKLHKTTPKREPFSIWHTGYLYQDGEINKEFIAFRKGYALAKHLCRQ